MRKSSVQNCNQLIHVYKDVTFILAFFGKRDANIALYGKLIFSKFSSFVFVLSLYLYREIYYQDLYIGTKRGRRAQFHVVIGLIFIYAINVHNNQSYESHEGDSDMSHNNNFKKYHCRSNSKIHSENRYP